MEEYIYHAVHIWSRSEGGRTVLSTHRTLYGAITAIEAHKEKTRMEWEKDNKIEPCKYPYDEDQKWLYEKVKLEN